VAVDIKLNNMIDALGRLERVRIEDVELSVRALRGLKNVGAVTLADAQRAIIDRTLIKQHHIGRRTVDEVREIIANVSALPDEALPPRDTVLREEDTEADLLRYENARLLDELKRKDAFIAALRLEPDRLSKLLQTERHNHTRTCRRLDTVIAMMSVADLRRAGIDVDITFNEED
jgi:hypothetical protein